MAQMQATEIVVTYERKVSDGVCVRCGKQVELPPKRRGRGEFRFCSWECRYPPVEERFWSRVSGGHPYGCLLWTGAVDKDGYGLITVEGKLRRATRVAYEFAYGPLGTSHAAHDCDAFYPAGDASYRRCVNPLHLFPATNDENHADKASKGRSPLGERNGRSILTAQDVIQIRQLYSSGGMTQKEISARYGVGQTRISAVVRRVQWRHVA